jgi:branched-chain amino acid transport system substrate-binding protein
MENEFVQNSKKLWGGDVDWQTAMAYDATQAILQAIKANPKATRETIKDALSRPGFIVEKGASQRFQFNHNDGDSIVRLVQIQKKKSLKESRSGTGYDFVQISP